MVRSVTNTSFPRHDHIDMNPDKIDIRRTHIPESDIGEATFDSRRDLDAQDWRRILDVFERRTSRGEIAFIASVASCIQLIDAKKNPSLPHGVKQKLVEDFGRVSEDLTILSLSTYTKIILPELEVTEGPLSAYKRGVLKYLQQARRNSSELEWMYFVQTMANLKILYPDESIQLEEADWKAIEKSLEDIKAKDWSDFASFAADMRILGHSKELDISEWLHMKARLQELRNKKEEFGWNLAHISKSLSILAAEKIKVTSKGLELIKNDGVMTEHGELPQTRTY